MLHLLRFPASSGLPHMVQVCLQMTGKGVWQWCAGLWLPCKVAVTDPNIQGFEIGSPLSVAGWAEKGANGVLCWR